MPKPTAGRHRSPRQPPADGVVRVIGGQWRGRKLPFYSAEGLRPTGDRIRETLFNWLAPYIAGAHCLDLFAGSGALGLEALSRGAASCDFVDTDPRSIEQIGRHLGTLACPLGKTHRQSAQQFLTAHSQPWDIVFLDPPFNKNLLPPILEHFDTGLSSVDYLYIEVAKDETYPTLSHWQELKQKTSGQVRYSLWQNNRR